MASCRGLAYRAYNGRRRSVLGLLVASCVQLDGEGRLMLYQVAEVDCRVLTALNYAPKRAVCCVTLLNINNMHLQQHDAFMSHHDIIGGALPLFNTLSSVISDHSICLDFT